MRVLVCGGRDYDREAHLFYEMDWLHKEHKFVLLIHGAARGADTLAGVWARRSGVQEVAMPANWDYHGKRAGVLRNAAMLLLEPDLVVAFPGGRGTANMVSLTKAAGIRVIYR